MRSENEVAFTRMHGNIAHGNGRKIATFIFSPALAAIDRYPQAKFGAQKQQRGTYGVFLNDVSVPANAAGLQVEHGPSLAVVGSLGGVRRGVAERVSVERGIGGG